MGLRHRWLNRFIAGAMSYWTVGACADEFATSPPPQTTVDTSSTLGDTMNVGQTNTLTIEVVDAEGHPLDSVIVEWTPSDDGIVDLRPSASGSTQQIDVVALNRGSVTVTARVIRPTTARQEIHRTILVRERWLAVTAGGVHTCALAHDSTAYCWGAVGEFQALRRFSGAGIGDGSQGQPLPAKVQTEFRFAGLAAGFGHSCGFTAPAGLPLCWGDNFKAQLGDESRFKRFIPTLVSGGITASLIGAGHDGTCAIRPVIDSTGRASSLSCWGDTAVVGDIVGREIQCCYQAPHRPLSALEPAGTRWTLVSVGANHTCGLAETGIHCWGKNSAGQLGDGTRLARRFFESKVEFPSPATVTSLSAGGNQTCAVISSGAGYCWGDNASGQLGIGRSGGSDTVPAPVELPGVVMISTAGSVDLTGALDMIAHTCAVTSDRKVHCWGDNRFGQIDGVPNPGERVIRPREVPIPGPDGVPVPIVGVGTAAYAHPEIAEPEIPDDLAAHTCALAQDGAIYCWGGNRFGQLGRGHTADTLSAPRRIEEPR